MKTSVHYFDGHIDKRTRGAGVWTTNLPFSRRPHSSSWATSPPLMKLMRNFGSFLPVKLFQMIKFSVFLCDLTAFVRWCQTIQVGLRSGLWRGLSKTSFSFTFSLILLLIHLLALGHCKTQPLRSWSAILASSCKSWINFSLNSCNVGFMMLQCCPFV